MEARDKLQRLSERAAIRRKHFSGQSYNEECVFDMDEIARQVMPYQVFPSLIDEEDSQFEA